MRRTEMLESPKYLVIGKKKKKYMRQVRSVRTNDGDQERYVVRNTGKNESWLRVSTGGRRREMAFFGVELRLIAVNGGKI